MYMIPTAPSLEQRAAHDAGLNQVLVNQLTWKASVCRDVAVAIVKAVMEQPGDVFPDQVPLDFVAVADSRVIGTAWKNLKRQGIVRHGTLFRRSAKEASHGRTIFAYTLGSRALAELFLKRNRAAARETQPELL